MDKIAAIKKESGNGYVIYTVKVGLEEAAKELYLELKVNAADGTMSVHHFPKPGSAGERSPDPFFGY